MNEFEDNGNYDSATSVDFDRWDDEERLDSDRRRRENATEEELEDPDFDVPY